MIKKLKLTTLALLAIIAGTTVNATTNLLQNVTVQFTYYTQATTNSIASAKYTTKNLIEDLTGSAPTSGEMLVRVTPVTNVPVTITNLVPVSTNVLVITNESTSELSVSNFLILGTNAAIAIGNTNYTFSTNTETVNGTVVTISNSVFYGSNGSLFIGSNTTVTTTPLTNAVGNSVGTSNVFVINTFTNTLGGTNTLGTAYWATYTTKGGLTALNTSNISFSIYTDHVYTLTNAAYVHGETIAKNGEIRYGQSDEIRTLVLSNSTEQVKLVGYAHGNVVPVSLGNTASAQVVYSKDYNWTGNGSGAETNGIYWVEDGTITEQYLKLLK